MKKVIGLLCVALAMSCSEPATKLNSNPNSNPNNVNSNPNNQTVNSNPNNQTANSHPGTFVDPNDFDKTCEWDSECELVWGGDVCGCLTICGDAIATSAVEAFQTAKDAIDCTGIDPPACPGAACQQQLAVCSSGTCTAITHTSVMAEDFDQSCEIDTDCMAVRTGPICPACDCSRGAINVDAYSAYLAATGEPDCNPGPQSCDCAPADQAFCNQGTCEVGFGG